MNKIELRGGRRKGAGKKKEFNNPVIFEIILEKKERDALQEKYKGNVSEKVREFLKTLL